MGKKEAVFLLKKKKKLGAVSISVFNCESYLSACVLALTACLGDDRAWNAMIVYWKLRQLYMLHDVFRIELFRQNNIEQNIILSKVHSSKEAAYFEKGKSPTQSLSGKRKG